MCGRLCLVASLAQLHQLLKKIFEIEKLSVADAFVIKNAVPCAQVINPIKYNNANKYSKTFLDYVMILSAFTSPTRAVTALYDS